MLPPMVKSLLPNRQARKNPKSNDDNLELEERFEEKQVSIEEENDNQGKKERKKNIPLGVLCSTIVIVVFVVHCR